MAVLLPVTLTTTLEYVAFFSTHNFYSDALGLTSVSVVISSVTVYARNTSQLLIVGGGTATSSTGTFIGGATSQIVFSGKHLNNFDQEKWKYRNSKYDSSTYTVISTDLLPASYFSLWNFTPDLRPTTTITVVVATSAGSFTLTQLVYNNWDYERDRIKTYINKGKVVTKQISKYLGY
jgi:hypothetical protein